MFFVAQKSGKNLTTPVTWARPPLQVALRVLYDHICLSPCFCQDIVTRHLAEKSAAEDQLPPLGPVVWAAGSQSELTPSESLATSDAVRNTLLLPSMGFSHISSLSPTPEVLFLFYPVILLLFLTPFYLLSVPYFFSPPALSPFILLCLISFNLPMPLFIPRF